MSKYPTQPTPTPVGRRTQYKLEFLTNQLEIQGESAEGAVN